jgi:anti-sigma regulatory factor (Ser/Thr protein kinase)
MAMMSVASTAHGTTQAPGDAGHEPACGTAGTRASGATAPDQGAVSLGPARRGPRPAQGAAMTAMRQTFDGTEIQLSQVRRWLEAQLPPSPDRDDLILIATELSTNAVQHTASGRGGQFTVEIAVHGAVIRVVVTDGGAPTEPRPSDDPLAERGRGLVVVQALARSTGVLGDRRGRQVWAELPWPCGAGSLAS